MKTVRWISRHALTAQQMSAIHEIHGIDVKIAHDMVEFSRNYTLSDYLRKYSGDFSYVVAGAADCVRAALDGLDFGIFVNVPSARQNGTFELDQIYHIRSGKIHNCPFTK